MVRAGGVLALGHGHGEGLLRLQGSEHQLQSVDLGIHGGEGGEKFLVKALVLCGQGAGLQGQHRLFRVCAQGQELDLLGLHRVAPQVDPGDEIALGRRDDQILLQQILQHDVAGAAGERIGLLLVLVFLFQNNGVAFPAQLLGFFLRADGDQLLLGFGIRIGQGQRVDQRFLPGDRYIRIVCPGQAAGELENKDQHQQHAQQHTKVLLHGYHLNMNDSTVFYRLNGFLAAQWMGTSLPSTT